MDNRTITVAIEVVEYSQLMVKNSFKKASISKVDLSRKQGKLKSGRLPARIRRAGYLLCLLLGLVVVDGLLSNFIVQMGVGKEGNPFIRSIVGQTSFISIKLLSALIGGLLLWRVFIRHPKLGLVSIIFFVVFYTAIVWWNLAIFFIAQV